MVSLVTDTVASLPVEALRAQKTRTFDPKRGGGGHEEWFSFLADAAEGRCVHLGFRASKYEAKHLSPEQKAQYKGKVQVDSVYEDKASARITLAVDTMRQGDQVSTRI